MAFATTRFPDGDHHPVISSSISTEEGGRVERQRLTAPHPLATEPGAPVRFTFRTEPRIRTANLPALNGTPLPIGPVRHTSG